MSKHFDRTWHLQIDLDEVKAIIEEHRDNFFCPFSNTESYLNIYKDRECAVQFLNLQHCDYSRDPNRSGERYIKYLMKVESKIGRQDTHKFLKTNYEKFTVETNEENFIVADSNPRIKSLVSKLQTMWAFDASNRPAGNICRARIVRLPAGGVMPYHRDETDDSNLRVICPIITHPDVVNAFKDDDGEHKYNLPATGHFYSFDETKTEHAVFNDSPVDRYALIFTVVGVDNIKDWDRAYYRNKKFWEAWSRGI